MDTLIKEVLESISASGLEDITAEDVKQLLAGGSSEEVVPSTDCDAEKYRELDSLKVTAGAELPDCGYPHSPLYLHLARRIKILTTSRSSDALNLPEFNYLNEGINAIERNEMFAALSGEICELQVILDENQLEASKHMLITIFGKLKKRGILGLLGLRQTEGTVEMLPPARSYLEKSFKQQNSLVSQLSVGARALSKHCHRDQTASWWGSSKGSEAAKNAHANLIMNRILDQATWINIHSLPHSVVTLEVRCTDGYGARWTADGESFRGFLEPQMEDGHSVGWRH